LERGAVVLLGARKEKKQRRKGEGNDGIME